MYIDTLKTFINKLETSEKDLTELEKVELKIKLKKKGEYRNINPFLTELNKLEKSYSSGNMNNITRLKITLIKTLLIIYYKENQGEKNNVR